MNTTINSLKNLTKRMAATLLAVGLTCVPSANAQTAQDRQHQERDAHARQQEEYGRVAAAQYQAETEAAAAAMITNGRGFLPGEIRDALNYGALAWYKKPSGQYGYVFNKGSIRDISASLNVDIECTRRRVACEGKVMVVNEWLVVGAANDRNYSVTGTGPTRAAAEAAVRTHCQEKGTTCSIRDAFDVIPHRRGAGFQRLQTVVR